MRQIAFHNGTAFFAEQDACKGIFQLSLDVNRGVFIFGVNSFHPIPLLLCDDGFVETLVEFVVIVDDSGFGEETIFDNLFHRFPPPADLA